MKTYKYFSVIVILALLIASLPVSVVNAAGTIVVMPSDVGVSWLTSDTRAGGSSSFVVGPNSPPAGVGSIQFTTTDTAGGSGQAKAQLFNYSYMGVNLDDLDALSYWTYRSSSSTNSLAQTISLNIEVDHVGDGSGFTTLVFEPYYQAGGAGAMLLNTWQVWDAFNGGNAIWWSTKDIPGVCAFDCFVTWDTILTDNPNAKVKYALGFNVGSGWVGEYMGAADNLAVGFSGDSTIYDFEPEPLDEQGPISSNVVASPNPAAVNSLVTVAANVDDTTTGGSDIASANYEILNSDDALVGSGSMSAVDGFNSPTEEVTANITAPPTAGIYDLCVYGTDAADNVGYHECIMFVVYDPSGGFVTGGGWINSPEGAMSSFGAVWDQDFSVDDAGWLDDDDAWYGDITVAGGTATFFGDGSGAPFSRFDGYRSTWPGTWVAEIDVYLDPAWPAGQGFDYSVAATGTDGAHQRDYIFHVGVVENYGPITGQALLVNASNNADFYTNPFKLVNDNGGNYYNVTTSGWYTLQHVFHDAGGYLAVDLNLLDSNGNILWTATRENVADTIPAEVGGNRYAWFTHIDVAAGIQVDNHQLFLNTPSPEGKAAFGFVSKYKKGASVPEGNTEFQFQAGGLNFHSTSYDWLVVNQGGANAQFKGSGTINDGLDPNGNAYKFMLWAGDNDPDTFHIRIWWEETDGTEHDVYDNGADQPIGGGSIVVHKAK